MALFRRRDLRCSSQRFDDAAFPKIFHLVIGNLHDDDDDDDKITATMVIIIIVMILVISKHRPAPELWNTFDDEPHRTTCNFPHLLGGRFMEILVVRVYPPSSSYLHDKNKNNTKTRSVVEDVRFG